MEGRVHPDARVPELLVEQLALGVLSPPADRAVRRRLSDAGVDVDARLQALRASNERELRRHPPARARRVIERRVEALRRRRRRARFWVSGAALTAVATALLWFPLATPKPELEPGGARTGIVSTTPTTTRTTTSSAPAGADEGPALAPERAQIKGLSPRLLIHRKRDEQIERLAEGDLARAGDRVQLSYVAAGRRRGVIVSYDGRGKVTLHYPDTAHASPRLHAGGAVPLDHSFELDDAPGFERFVLVTAPEEDEDSFTVERVLAAARAVASADSESEASRLPLPEGWEQVAFELVKVAR